VTNNHVISNVTQAVTTSVTFNYETKSSDFFVAVTDRCPTFSLNPERFFWTFPDLDVTLVALGTQKINDAPRDFKLPTPLSLDINRDASITSYLPIIGHPNGMERKLSLRGSYIEYVIPTHPCASSLPSPLPCLTSSIMNPRYQMCQPHRSTINK
jgi:hypothetical protein